MRHQELADAGAAQVDHQAPARRRDLLPQVPPVPRPGLLAHDDEALEVGGCREHAGGDRAADHGEARLRALAVQLVEQAGRQDGVAEARSEEHTSELQSLLRISYAVFCLKKKKEMNIQ